MDKLLLKALGSAYRKLFPIDPVLTPCMQVLILRLAAAEARPQACAGARHPVRSCL